MKRFGRTMIATARLRDVATGIGVTTPAAAKDHLDWLVKRDLVEKPMGAHGGWQVADEPRIPVILATGRVDPDEPLLAGPRIIETIRGVLGETFKPEVEFFVLVEVETECTKMLAISTKKDATNGTTVVGRIRDEIVIGKIQRRDVKIETCSPGSERITRLIDRTDPDFRLEGIVVGTIKATPTPITD